MSYSAWQYAQAGYVHSAGGPNCSGILVSNPNPLHALCLWSLWSKILRLQQTTTNCQTSSSPPWEPMAHPWVMYIFVSLKVMSLPNIDDNAWYTLYWTKAHWVNKKPCHLSLVCTLVDDLTVQSETPTRVVPTGHRLESLDTWNVPNCTSPDFLVRPDPPLQFMLNTLL